MKKIGLLLLLLSVFAFAFVPITSITIAGSIKYPDNTPFNGTLFIALKNPARLNTSASGCSSATLIPSLIGTPFTVTNGTISTVPLTPNDCLLPQQPYEIQLIDTNKKLYLMTNWWLGGGYNNSALNPSTGNKWIHPVGVGSSSIGVIYTMPPGGYQVAQQTVTALAAGGTIAKTFTWPIRFDSTAYAVACSSSNINLGVQSFGSQLVTSQTATIRNISDTGTPVTASGLITCRARAN